MNTTFLYTSRQLSLIFSAEGIQTTLPMWATKFFQSSNSLLNSLPNAWSGLQNLVLITSEACHHPYCSQEQLHIGRWNAQQGQCPNSNPEQQQYLRESKVQFKNMEMFPQNASTKCSDLWLMHFQNKNWIFVFCSIQQTPVNSQIHANLQLLHKHMTVLNYFNTLTGDIWKLF